MGSADIRNGRRGHRNQNGPAPPLLSAEQAAPLLGCTVRHVRRLIASGDLAGHKDPYRTWSTAVDAYRRRAQPLEGDVVAQQGADIHMSACGQAQSAETAEGDNESTAVMVAIAAELAGARDQIERLARENGRLASQLEQVQIQGPPRLGRPRPSALRLVRWLRAGGRP